VPRKHRSEPHGRAIRALITAEARRHGGDVTAGLTAAVGWISDHLPMYALNLVLITATALWALRYPDTHELYVLDRAAGGGAGQGLDVASSRIHAQSPDLAGQPSVIVASEQMDDDPGWRLLAPGELLHVGPALQISSSAPFPPEPAHLLRVSDLDPAAAASQHPEAAPS
jgi:glutamine amidotransferase